MFHRTMKQAGGIDSHEERFLAEGLRFLGSKSRGTIKDRTSFFQCASRSRSVKEAVRFRLANILQILQKNPQTSHQSIRWMQLIGLCQDMLFTRHKTWESKVIFTATEPVEVQVRKTKLRQGSKDQSQQCSQSFIQFNEVFMLFSFGQTVFCLLLITRSVVKD